MTSFILLLALADAGEPATTAWTSFLGGTSNVTAARGLPRKWSPTENIAWKVDLPGYGQSCPVVWKDSVFVTAVAGEQREQGFVAAYDAVSGKKRWLHELAPTQKAKWSNMISRAAPTPVVDAAALYTFFEGGDLLALTHDGKRLWSRSLVKDFGEFQNGHGLGASLAQTEDSVIVLIDHRGPSYLLAVDKQTGKDRWKTERPERSSWTSPIVARRGGKAEVIVSSNGSVAGYDAATGKRLWEMEGLSGNTLPSVAVAGEQLVVGAGLGRTGGDPAQAAKSNCCLKLVQKDGKPGYEVCWNAARATASYATPLICKGQVYFINQQGVVFCHDLKTGKELYAERIDSTCWATPLAAGDQIYFFGKDGQTTILKAGPIFAKLAVNALWNVEGAGPQDQKAPTPRAEERGGNLDPIIYGVAAVDGAFYVRTGTALYRIGKP